jgi:hypothetical protein
LGLVAEGKHLGVGFGPAAYRGYSVYSATPLALP